MRHWRKTVAKHPRPLHFRRARDVFSYLRVHPDLSADEFAGVMMKLMSGFAPNLIADAMIECLDDLRGPSGMQLLMLIDQLQQPALLEALREWFIAQTDMSVDERLPVILVLHRGGQEVADILGPEDAEAIAARQENAVHDMLDTLQNDPTEMPAFLESLTPADPQRRKEIIDELSRFTDHPAIADVVKYLALSYDPIFAAGALGLLERIDSPTAKVGIQQVALLHPQPVLRMRARQMVGEPIETPPIPELIDGHVTMIDGRGSGGIVLVARRHRKCVVTWFLCNAGTGVKDLVGHVDLSVKDRDSVLKETLALAHGLDVMSGVPELAAQLLADALTRCGPHTSLELPYWLDQTAGVGLLPAPFEPTFEEWRLTKVPPGKEYRTGIWEILSRMGCWFEEADLVYDYAEQLLKEQFTPDRLPPTHDARHEIVEQLIRPRLDQYRRMLLWMAGLWRERAQRDPKNATAADERVETDIFHVRVAMTTAEHLEEPSTVEMDHPFLAGLVELSLFKAMRSLAAGIDLREPETRRAADAGEDLFA